MDVIATATALGLTATDGDAVLGTIEEAAVLEALAALAAQHPGHEDLFAEAAARVQLSRSGGLERVDPGSVFAVRRVSPDVQLHYRSDMLEAFVDLAIDLGIREQAALSELEQLDDAPTG